MKYSINFSGYQFLFRRTKTISKNLGIPEEKVTTYSRVSKSQIFVPIEKVKKLYEMESDIFVTEEEAQIALVRDALPTLRKRDRNTSTISMYEKILNDRLRKIKE